MSVAAFKSDLTEFIARLDRTAEVDPEQRRRLQKEYNDQICRIFAGLRDRGALGSEAGALRDQVKLAHRKIIELKSAKALHIPVEGCVGATGIGAVAVSYVLPASIYASILGYAGVALLSGLAVKTIYDCYSRSAVTDVPPESGPAHPVRPRERSESRPLTKSDEKKAAPSTPFSRAQARFNAAILSSARDKACTGISDAMSSELQKTFLRANGDRRGFCIAIDREIKRKQLSPEQGYHIVRQFDEAYGARSGFYSFVDGMRQRGEVPASSAYYVIRHYDVASSQGNPHGLTAQLRNMVRHGYLSAIAASSIKRNVIPMGSVHHLAARPVSFDAAQWSRDYQAEGLKDKGGAQNAMLAEVYKDTCIACDSGFKVGAREVHLDPAKRHTTRTKSERVNLASMPTADAVPATFAVRAVVDQRPSTTVAHDMAQRGLKPLVLDMANQFSHGGGVIRGARAQEETLCRQSNLMEGLLSIPYPLGEFEGVLVPQVQFFRADGTYEFRDPFAVDVIAIAAYNRAHGQGPHPWNPAYARGNKNKIRLLLRTALSKGNDSLVLGALGCGAFGNNPRTIAGYFKEVLAEREFAGKFKEIRFAIIPDHNDPRNANVTEFRRVFP